jgi:hypothetical protein
LTKEHHHRGIACPRCAGVDFKTNQHGDYVVAND